MMRGLSQVEIFLEVVKQVSFVKAAKVLGMTGPAVSKQVKALEGSLGVRLLNRTTRLVSLTEEGAIYSEKAAKAINDLYEAKQEIQELKACPTGPLKVSLPMTFGIQFLTKPVSDFCKAYPNVALDVNFDDRRVDMVAENYDVVIRIGRLEDSNLIARKMNRCPILLCASPLFLKGVGNITNPSQLTTLPAIIFNKHSNESLWRYKKPKNEIISVKLNPALRSNNAHMIVQACLDGIGIAQIPIFSAAKYLKSGELIQLLKDYPSFPQSNIYIVYKHKSNLSTRLNLFIEAMMSFAKTLPW
jgi:DNA-binding transcriptional LysR family regulator